VAKWRCVAEKRNGGAAIEARGEACRDWMAKEGDERTYR
jgi:hypothetical protein